MSIRFGRWTCNGYNGGRQSIFVGDSFAGFISRDQDGSLCRLSMTRWIAYDGLTFRTLREAQNYLRHQFDVRLIGLGCAEAHAV